jgi:hypothetical protein
MAKRKRLMLIAGVLLMALYIGSYISLSRRGYAEAGQYNMTGFYYFTPANSDNWRFKNYGCVYLFWPLNVIDRWIGPGRYPASEPLWGLSAFPSRPWHQIPRNIRLAKTHHNRLRKKMAVLSATTVVSRYPGWRGWPHDQGEPAGVFGMRSGTQGQVLYIIR